MPTDTALRPAGARPPAPHSAAGAAGCSCPGRDAGRDAGRAPGRARPSHRRRGTGPGSRGRNWGLPLALAAAVVGMGVAMLVPVRAEVPPGARAWTRHIEVQGQRRSELVIAPAHLASGLPLYVVLHGSDASPAFEERRTGLSYLAGEGRALLVYPAGLGESWNAGQGCCGYSGRTRSDDVAFVEAVVADAVSHFGVDPRRVYLVGYSNGGKMALRMLAVDPDAFAGVAVYAATPLVPVGHGPPVPVLVAGGTADDRTPWAGPPRVQNGALAPSVTGAAAILRRRDRVGATATLRLLAGGRVTVETWRGTTARQVVTLVGYRGRGHAWPQARDSPLVLARLIVGFFDSLGPAPIGP